MRILVKNVPGLDIPFAACGFCGTRYTFCHATAQGYYCTREPGHDGPHVACGTSHHQCIIWEDSNENAKVPVTN